MEFKLIRVEQKNPTNFKGPSVIYAFSYENPFFLRHTIVTTSAAKRKKTKQASLPKEQHSPL